MKFQYRSTKPFEAKKGLRQRDPLSPFLFVLIMEYFGRILRTLSNEKEFKYHSKCAKMRLVQLVLPTTCFFSVEGILVLLPSRIAAS